MILSLSIAVDTASSITIIIHYYSFSVKGVVPIDAARAALKSGSLFDVDELVEIIRERLNITTLNAEIAANKHGVAANKKEISVKSKDITTIKTDIINLRSGKDFSRENA